MVDVWTGYQGEWDSIDGTKEINSHGWADAASFTDNDRSASRHATKEREEFERLIESTRAGKGDVLGIWEISRNQRDLAG